MIKSWFKKQVRAALEENIGGKHEDRAVERALEGSAPAVIAFRIKNGFLLRNNVVPALGSIGPKYMEPEFVYCADAQALGDAIVAAHVRDRMQESSRPHAEQQVAMMEMPSRPATNRI